MSRTRAFAERGVLPIPQMFGLYVACALFATNMYLTISRAMSGWSAAIWCGTVLFVAAASFGPHPAESWWTRIRSLPKFRFENAAIGAVISAPILLHLALTLRQEFPYSGDNDFHFEAFYAFGALGIWQGAFSRVILMASMVLVLIALAVVKPATWRRLGWIAIPAVFALFLVFSLFYAKRYGIDAMSRYPGLGYVLAVPAHAIERLLASFGYEAPLSVARRLSNALAVPVWLFILRPALLGRWPDRQTLPVGLFLFFEPGVIYYATSAYLEIWGMVFALLAAEVLIREGDEGAPRACLLIGLAAIVKEPFAFLLPFVWLAGRPWRAPWPRRASMLAAGAAAALPFTMYIAFRKSRGITRSLDPEFGRLLSGEMWQQFVHRVTLDLGATGTVVLACALTVVAFACTLRHERRWQFRCLAAGATFAWLLFMLDENTGGYVGISRFNLPVLPFIAACAWHPLVFRPDRPNWRSPLAAAALVLAGYATPLQAAWQRATGPDAERNFIEHYDAAIFLPIRQLLERARTEGVLDGIDRVISNQPDMTVTDIKGLKYVRPITFDAAQKLHCRCRDMNEGVMALFVPTANIYRGLDQGLPGEERGFSLLPRAYYDIRGDERYLRWKSQMAEAPACLAELRASCERVFSTDVRGQPWGALGIGVRR